MKNVIILLIVSLALMSCEKDERVIDNSKTSLDLYLADSITNDVSIYDYPDLKLLKADIIKNSGIEISSPVATIREFQRKIYLFVPNEDKVIVFDAITDTLITVNEFPFGSGPYDISFANPADGFVIFKSAPYVVNYDLVFNKIAKTIDGQSLVSSVSNYKSFSYLSESQTRQISVLDNRSYRNDGYIKLTGKPVLSTVTSDNELLVITLGVTTKKPDEEPVTTPTEIHFINPDDKTLRFTREFGDVVINSTEVVPNDIISSPLGFAYVTTNKGLIRIDTRNNGSLIDVSKRIFDKIEYSAQLKSLLLLEKTGSSVNLAQGSVINGVVVGSDELPSNTNTFHISF